MEDKEISAAVKARLICSGTLLIPPEMRLKFPTSKSSAGPGAGSESIVICFNASRVKMPISREKGALELRQTSEERFEIVENGKVILPDVTLQPTLCHAPGQAFVCLGRSCNMDCLFCTINTGKAKDKETFTIEKAFNLIMTSSKRPDFEAVAITSGILTTIDDQIKQMITLIKKIRKELQKVPIGVEPLAITRDHLRSLKIAGADEVKVNLEAARKDIFNKVCPKRDYETTVRSIEWAVDEFGEGAVTSNIIVGFGEDDSDICDALEMLAEIGSIGNLRMLRVNDVNRSKLINALGPLPVVNNERLIRLGKMQKEILERHDLSAKKFSTMCFSCGCCDLIPGIDL